MKYLTLEEKNEIYHKLEKEYILNIFNFLKTATDEQLKEVATYLNNVGDEYELDVVKYNVRDSRERYLFEVNRIKRGEE